MVKPTFNKNKVGREIERQREKEKEANETKEKKV